MATGPRYAVKFRRRREGRTDYRRRLALMKSRLPRLVVRKTNMRIIAQIITASKEGDKVVAHADSSELKALGWTYGMKNISAAYLIGYVLAHKCKCLKLTSLKDIIVDTGRHTITKGAKIFAVVSGAVAGGLNIPHDAKKFPSADRINGAHISADVKKSIEAVKLNVAKLKVDSKGL